MAKHVLKGGLSLKTKKLIIAAINGVRLNITRVFATFVFSIERIKVMLALIITSALSTPARPIKRKDLKKFFLLKKRKIKEMVIDPIKPL